MSILETILTSGTIFTNKLHNQLLFCNFDKLRTIVAKMIITPKIITIKL